MSSQVKHRARKEHVGQIRRVLPDLSDKQARDLAGVISRLVAALRPERIYVFGSYAKGTATPDSDIDLLVVVPQSDLPPHRRDQLAYQAAGEHLIPVDILVITHQEFERQQRAMSSLPATVLREGRVLYAA